VHNLRNSDAEEFLKASNIQGFQFTTLQTCL